VCEVDRDRSDLGDPGEPLRDNSLTVLPGQKLVSTLKQRESPRTALTSRFSTRIRSFGRWALSLLVPIGKCTACAPNSCSRKGKDGTEPPSRIKSGSRCHCAEMHFAIADTNGLSRSPSHWVEAQAKEVSVHCTGAERRRLLTQSAV
jgi:hypothetical protein